MKEKRIHQRAIYWVLTLMIPLLAAVAIMSTYGYVKKQAVENYENPIEAEENIKSYFKGNYVLYKSLYEKVNGESIGYADLYYQDMENILGEDYEYYISHNQAELDAFKSSIDDVITREAEREFSIYSEILDYYIEDTNSGIVISNTETDIINNTDGYVFRLEIVYDEKGNAFIGDIKAEDTEKVRKYATDLVLVRNKFLKDFVDNYINVEDDVIRRCQQYGTGPVNCRIIYGVTTEVWQQYQAAGLQVYSFGGLYSTVYHDYMATDVLAYIMWAFVVVALLAVYLPLAKLNKKPYSEGFLGKIPVEILACVITCVMALASEIRFSIVKLLEGHSADALYEWAGLPDKSMATFLVWSGHFLLLYSIFLLAWFCGLCLRVFREKGFKDYVKENWLFYRLCAFCKRQVSKVFEALEHIDVTKSAKKTILKIVLVNALILMIISSMWLGGWGFVVVYSFLLYFGMKLYVSKLQTKYNVLLHKIEEVSEGNLSVDMTEDLGIFNPMKEKLSLIQTGFRSAVEKEVQSQRMKTELITNVSHDLKTPLTAIITYVDLLKEENLPEDKRKEYLDTLERKSLRLKVLIEDLFEVSKANSGNVTLNYMDVDICNLVKQVRCELADKLEQADLDVRMELPDKKVMVSLDSQKTYRIYENLFSNIAKYSLPGTRVYVQGVLTEKEISISLKNISAQEITVNASKLAERFVRGDESRNTEGSGLGLAIAKSFVELQGGKFTLESDGDLFKVTTIFSVKNI